MIIRKRPTNKIRHKDSGFLRGGGKYNVRFSRDPARALQMHRSGIDNTRRRYRNQGNTSIAQVPSYLANMSKDVFTNRTENPSGIQYDLDNNIYDMGVWSHKSVQTSFNNPANVTKSQKEQAKKTGVSGIFQSIISFFKNLGGKAGDPIE